MSFYPCAGYSVERGNGDMMEKSWLGTFVFEKPEGVDAEKKIGGLEGDKWEDFPFLGSDSVCFFKSQSSRYRRVVWGRSHRRRVVRDIRDIRLGGGGI